jgi:hypothetical protein
MSGLGKLKLIQRFSQMIAFAGEVPSALSIGRGLRIHGCYSVKENKASIKEFDN